MREIFDVLVPRHFTPPKDSIIPACFSRDQWVVPPRPREDVSWRSSMTRNLRATKMKATIFPSSRGPRTCLPRVCSEEGLRMGRYRRGGDRKVFIPHPSHENFKKHLLLEAQIARCRVRTRPRCPICGTRMKIGERRESWRALLALPRRTRQRDMGSPGLEGCAHSGSK